MKKDNINYFMVGLFTLAGLLLFMFMLIRIAGGQAGTDEYFVMFDNVTGVKDGVIVTYSGYEIGSVKSLQPVVEKGKTRYQLSLQVKSGWRIPADSRAQIVIADKQIEITQGVDEHSLKPGDTIQSIEAVDIMQLVDSIAQELNQFVPQSTRSVNELLHKLHASADQVGIILSDKNVDHLNNLFVHADASSKRLSQLAESFNRINLQLNAILDKTDLLLEDNSEDIRYTVIEMKKSIDSVSSRIESVMYNLDATSQNMNEFSRTLRNNPGAILNSNPPADSHGVK